MIKPGRNKRRTSSVNTVSVCSKFQRDKEHVVFTALLLLLKWFIKYYVRFSLDI